MCSLLPFYADVSPLLQLRSRKRDDDLSRAKDLTMHDQTQPRPVGEQVLCTEQEGGHHSKSAPDLGTRLLGGVGGVGHWVAHDDQSSPSTTSAA
jgi:hypothetical protein